MDRYSSEFFNDYRQSTSSQNIGKITFETGIQKTEEETLSVNVGISASVGSDASFYKASLSVQLGWSRTNSSSYSYSVAKEFGPYTADAGTCVQILSVQTAFEGVSEQGALVTRADGKSTDGVIYLRFPVAGN